MTPPSVTGADGRVRTTWWATKGGGGIGRNCYRPSPTPRRGLGDSCLLLFRIGGATMGTASRVSACRRCGGCGAVLGGLCLVFLQQRGARDVLTKVWPYGFKSTHDCGSQLTPAVTAGGKATIAYSSGANVDDEISTATLSYGTT